MCGGPCVIDMQQRQALPKGFTTCAYRHEYRHVYRHAHRHVYRHVHNRHIGICRNMCTNMHIDTSWRKRRLDWLEPKLPPSVHSYIVMANSYGLYSYGLTKLSPTFHVVSGSNGTTKPPSLLRTMYSKVVGYKEAFDSVT